MKKPFENIVEEGKKCWLRFVPFPKTNFNVMFHMSSVMVYIWTGLNFCCSVNLLHVPHNKSLNIQGMHMKK